MNLAAVGEIANTVQNIVDLSIAQVDDMDREEADQGAVTIALVAHDNMKKMLRKFVQAYAGMLKEFYLTGTGTSCSILRSEGLEPFGSIVSGPLGGDQQLGAMVVQGEIQAVFFFRDPLSAHAHIDDIQALGRLLDCYQVYFSTNYRSAAAILKVMYDTKMSGRAGTLAQRDLAGEVQEQYKATRAAAVAGSAVSGV